MLGDGECHGPESQLGKVQRHAPAQRRALELDLDQQRRAGAEPPLGLGPGDTYLDEPGSPSGLGGVALAKRGEHRE
jgi:hypothetical protein